ncbi:MAG: YicC family protein [Bacteroidales bacterium]|nr:YicC family protein [Bacteroidales bacterium]MBK7626125.1 YicC family protein [Bacteroidales bacterium]
MTGYGKAIAETPQKKITIEIKSLNSKQLDLNTKLPWLYKEKEPEIRNLISQKLDRGKIDFSVYCDMLDDEVVTVINKTAVRNYYNQFKEIASDLKIDLDDQIFTAIMKLPDTLKTEKPEMPEGEWELVKKQIIESIDMLDLYRIEEGNSITTDLKKCIGKILSFLETIGTYESGRIAKVREKLDTLLEEAVGKENIDKNRFEQELIFYLEKYDINEEKVRLKTHCDYFLETMNTPAPNGKILNFITQEIGREINTIGSKANDASIQKLVVMMKDELEKIKEQTLNVL